MFLWENMPRILTWDARNISSHAAKDYGIRTLFTQTGQVRRIRIPPSHSQRPSKIPPGQSLWGVIWKKCWDGGIPFGQRSDPVFYVEGPMGLFPLLLPANSDPQSSPSLVHRQENVLSFLLLYKGKYIALLMNFRVI